MVFYMPYVYLLIMLAFIAYNVADIYMNIPALVQFIVPCMFLTASIVFFVMMKKRK